MTDSLNKHLNRAFMTFPRRSERTDRDTLVSTFVDIGPLFTVMSIHDNQIIYGRRGTGKTHALQYLTSMAHDKGDIAIYIDINSLGSNSSICNNYSLPLTERATRLLVDTLIALHDGLLDYAVHHAEDVDLSKIGPQLDILVRDISDIRIAGPIEKETQNERISANSNGARVAIDASLTDFALRMEAERAENVELHASERAVRKGDPLYYIHFGSVSRTIQNITNHFGKRVWLMLDEWSSIPSDLQPYLSDLLRRTLFTNPTITIKIGAIEHRSIFQIRRERSEYVGLELGADITADINLDDFMVFDNDEYRSSAFFKEFLFRHMVSAGQHLGIPDAIPNNAHELIRVAFTQQNTFTEYVRAIEGVPRDAININ